MYRGRLEIFSPDGPVESYFIEKETIAIGRSTGNDLVIDRHGISRYHVTLAVKDQQGTLEDLESVNGTYVDGLRLESHNPRVLRGGEEIQLGDIRLIFHPIQELDLTRPTNIQIVETDVFYAELDGPAIAAAPGAHAPATLKITNKSQALVRFTLQVEGMPKEWVRLDRTELELDADTDTQVGVSFKPLRRPESQPGDYPITVYIKTDNGATAEIRSRLQILAYSGFGAAIGTALITDDQPFKLFIHNQGNAPLRVHFTGTSRETPMRFAFRPPQVTLGPGERQTVLGEVALLRRPLFMRRSRTYRYDVVSHSHDAAAFQAPVSGEYQVTPLFPVWLVGVLVPVVFLIAVVIGLLTISLFNTPSDNATVAPVIANPIVELFQVEGTTAIRLEEPLIVTWRTEGASQVWVEAHRSNLDTLTYALPGVQGTGHLIQLPEAGYYTVNLIAEQDGARASKFINVSVSPIISLQASTAPHGTHLYRNFESQRVQLQWQVQWTTIEKASDTLPIQLFLKSDVLGLENEPLQEAASLVPRIFEIAPLGAPTEQVMVELLVIGPDNVQTTEAVIIAVEYPVCTTQAAQTDVYRGPSADFALVSALPLDTTINVEARTVDDTWLYIHIPSDYVQVSTTGWIEQKAVSCDGFATADIMPVPDVAPASNG